MTESARSRTDVDHADVATATVTDDNIAPCGTMSVTPGGSSIGRAPGADGVAGRSRGRLPQKPKVEGSNPSRQESDGPVHVELFGGAGGTAEGIARALAPAGITVWSVDNDEKRHARNPYAWFTGDWLEGFDRALQTGRVVSHSGGPPCTANSAGTRALDRSRYDNDPTIEGVREAFVATGLPYVIENVESEVTKRRMISPLRLCGSEFDLQADDPATGLRLWLKRHRLFESNLPLMGNGGCRHPKGLRCAGAYGGARRDEVEARTIRKGGYVPKDIEVLRELLGAPEWMTEQDMFLSIPPAFGEHLGVQILAAIEGRVAA